MTENAEDEASPLLVKNENDPPPQTFFQRFIQPCTVEFFGVTVFVFIGTMSACLQSADTLAVAVTHGLTIAVLISGLGHISGGHFNPAITLGVLAGGGLSPFLALGYFISQLIGAILGAALCMGVLSQTYTNNTGALPIGDAMNVTTAYQVLGGGVHATGVGVTAGQAILCETVLTMLLVLTVLMTAVNGASKLPFAGFAIGLSITVDILAAGNITGGSMNPARSFGPAVVMSRYGPDAWKNHYVYWIGPALGSVIAASFYRVLFADEDGRVVFKGGKQA